MLGQRMPMLRMVSLFAVMAGATLALGADRPTDNENFIKFKEKMLPKVGQRIEVAGTLQGGKLGWWLSFDEWGVYIYSLRDTDLSKQNDLNRFDQRKVTVRGILRHRDALVPDGIAAGIPEHFYFDVAEATVKETK
jgi:hypothetical protein